VSENASLREIKERYKQLSLVTHPDKQRVDADNQEEITASFNQIKTAFQYLSHQHTRIIYDNYAVPGLMMYERYKDAFEPIVEKLRDHESAREIDRDTAWEQKRHELEYVSNHIH